MKRFSSSLGSILLFTAGFFITGCQKSSQQHAEESTRIEQSTEPEGLPADVSAEEKKLYERARQFFQPLPSSADNDANPMTAEKVALGKMLYFDPRLSLSGFISCNSCHNLATAGVDNLPTSIGHKWQLGPRNAPTTLNAALHFSQFWDGREPDVEAQAQKPITNPIEMAIPNEDYLVQRLASIPQYVEHFRKAFPAEDSPLSYSNIANAIAAFERTLLTPAPFDRYLKGDVNALSSTQKEGLRLFMDIGCITCHTGPLLGGQMFQKFGTYGNYWEYTQSEKIDSGRYAVTGKESDLFMFKVPSLRNIVETYPYFHDGSVWELDRAVRIMAKTQLNKELTDDEAQKIVAFLTSLTGAIPAEALQLPVLPPSTPSTSRPER